LWPGVNLIDGRRPSTGEALHMTGYHWRFFDFSDITVNADSVLDFIEKCILLESVTCGFSDLMHARFKSSILPSMKHLHTLVVAPYYENRLGDFSITRIPREMDIKPNAGRMPNAWDSFYEEPEIPDWKRFDWARQEKEEEDES
jgi:hypothetical protein